jgi:hypothetical protein
VIFGNIVILSLCLIKRVVLRRCDILLLRKLLGLVTNLLSFCQYLLLLILEKICLLNLVLLKLNDILLENVLVAHQLLHLFLRLWTDLALLYFLNMLMCLLKLSHLFIQLLLHLLNGILVLGNQ